ncbi:MAG: heme exporter protein CcmD [Nitrospirae bacterium]|nr:heme exporter protein CcmD [Magnetococcales bacterium]
MPDYSVYVIAVYALATLVYGGVTLSSWRAIKTIETRIAQQENMPFERKYH